MVKQVLTSELSDTRDLCLTTSSQTISVGNEMFENNGGKIVSLPPKDALEYIILMVKGTCSCD